VIHTYWVYILASRSRVLYTGVTNDLGRRVREHKQGLIAGFTQKYRVTRLVHFEQFGDIQEAIAREKQLKGWVRARKVELIEGRNPTWADLSPSFFVTSQRDLSS
jgi:putative endonuclease